MFSGGRGRALCTERFNFRGHDLPNVPIADRTYRGCGHDSSTEKTVINSEQFTIVTAHAQCRFATLVPWGCRYEDKSARHYTRSAILRDTATPTRPAPTYGSFKNTYYAMQPHYNITSRALHLTIQTKSSHRAISNICTEKPFAMLSGNGKNTVLAFSATNREFTKGYWTGDCEVKPGRCRHDWTLRGKSQSRLRSIRYHIRAA